MRAIEWIASSDIVEWLVPAPSVDPAPLTTFRDSELVLGMLEVSHICLAQPIVSRDDCVWVIVGPASWCTDQEQTHTPSVRYTIEECLQTFASGACPAFFDGPFDSVGFLICVDTWLGFQPLPDPLLPAKAFRTILDKEVLYGDLSRLALRLWGLGVPASLFFPDSASHALAPLPELGSLEQGLQAGRRFLRNQWAHW